MLITGYTAWMELITGRKESAVTRRRRGAGLTSRRCASAATIELLEDRALLTDLTPPVVVSATAIDNPGGATFSSVRVQFDEAVAPASATNAQNYRLVKADGSFAALTAATLDASDTSGKTVILTAAAQLAGTSYSVHVGGVADLSGNASPAIGRDYVSVATSVAPLVGDRTMVIGDFDKDGITDLITASTNDQDVWFVKGLGGGSFAARTLSFSVTGTRLAMEAADFDGDGNLDLVTQDWTYGSPHIVVNFGKGDGTFEAGRLRNQTGGTQLYVTDIDRDGDMDIAVTGGEVTGAAFTVYYNPWNPRDTPPGSQTAIRAFDTWSSFASVGDYQGWGLHFSDFNLDGRVDIMEMRRGTASPRVWLASATPRSFDYVASAAPVDGGQVSTSGDFNGDGRLDVFFAGSGQIMFGTAGSPYFGAPQATAFGNGLGRKTTSAVDIDGDGDLDLILGASPDGYGNIDPNVYILYNQGGVFDSTVRAINLSGLGVQRVSKLSFADLNGDGLPEIIGLDTSSDRYFVMKSQLGASSATVTFVANRAPSPSAGGSYSITEGGSLTLNAGGSTDPDGDSLTYSWDLNGDGVFGDATGVAPTLTWSQLAALGINDNGVRSLVVRATDPRGWSVTNAATLTILNTPPTLILSGAATSLEGSSYTVNLASSDPGNDTIASWLINWGDGTNSTVAGNPSSKSHVYADNGNYTITATATDEDGTYSAGNSVAVGVANVKPTLTSTMSSTFQTTVSPITYTATATDPAGANDTLTFTWTVSRFGIVVATATGSSFTFTPLVGVSTVSVTVNDEDPGSGTSSASATLTVKGKADLIGYSAGAWTVGVSTGSAFSTSNWSNWTNNAAAPVATGDFNGDGAVDVLRMEGTTLRVGLAGTSGFGNTTWGDLGTTAGTYLVVGDVNGDGRADVLTRSDSAWQVSLSTGSGFAPKAAWVGWADIAWADVNLVDLNGDGRADLIARTQGNQWWAALANDTGTGFTDTALWTTWTTNATWESITFADYNGDGKADIAGRIANEWWIAVSTGTTFAATTRWIGWNSAYTWQDHRLGDFNGDGKTDAAARIGAGNWWIALSNGKDGFNTPTPWGYWNPTSNWQDIRIGDFTGDGKADIAGRIGGNWWVSVSTGSGFANASIWTTGWTATYSLIVVGNVTEGGAAAAPLAGAKAIAATGGSTAVQKTVVSAAKEESLALFWTSAKDDERFAAALLGSSKA